MKTQTHFRAHRRNVSILALLAAASAFCSLGVRAQNNSVVSYEADAAYNAFHAAFLQQPSGATYYGNTVTDHSEAFMWGQASDIFVDEDYWERTHNPATATLISNLLNRFEVTNGTSWTWDSWNDDMEWGILAFIRGYQVTGNTSYLTIAANNWNAVYSRGWDTTYGGGGIWENMANLSGTTADKLALSNCPFIIAGCWLYEATGNSTYLNESEADYSFVWNNVINHTSSSSSFGGPGQVNEGVRWTLGQPNSAALESSDNVYNSGSFLEAGEVLYEVTGNVNYYNDEVRDINHIVGEGPVMGVPYEPGNPQYQYWFVKGLSEFCTFNNQWPTYYAWLLGNANAAWSHRDSYNLTEDNWGAQETNSNPACLDSSSAVTIWQALDVPQQYQIINKNSGLAMDLIAGNEANLAPINQWAPSSDDANQDWMLAPLSNGSYGIISGLTAMGAAIQGASTSNGAQLVDWPYTTTDSSLQFNLISEGSGWDEIQNVNSGLVLDDNANGTSNGTTIIQWTPSGANNQLWELVPVTSFTGTFEIQNVLSGMALDVYGGQTTSGVSVIQWPYGGGSNQKWTFVPTNNGYYQIINVNSGLALSVSGASLFNGGEIVQWPAGGWADQWIPVKNSDGTWTFYNLDSGLALDDPANSTSQGTQFDQWVTNGGQTNQKFNLIAQ